MGFQVEVNSILRSDAYAELTRGEVLAFSKSGSRVFIDNIPVWLTRSDWTALAEVQILSQTRAGGRLRGEFEVLHVYSGSTQQQMTDTFRRMFADAGSPFIYLLMSADALRLGKQSAKYAPESLHTDGFIHASPGDQLTRIANKYYADQEMLHVAVVRKSKIGPPVKWEPATGGLYPHIYGPLNMDAIVEVIPFFRDSEKQHSILLPSRSRSSLGRE